MSELEAEVIHAAEAAVQACAYVFGGVALAVVVICAAAIVHGCIRRPR